MRILFQGDSITDCGRDYNNDSQLGRGYARLVESALGYQEPGEHTFITKESAVTVSLTSTPV